MSSDCWFALAYTDVISPYKRMGTAFILMAGLEAMGGLVVLGDAVLSVVQRWLYTHIFIAQVNTHTIIHG